MAWYWMDDKPSPHPVMTQFTDAYMDHKANCFVHSLRPSDAYIYVRKLTIIGSDNGLAPARRQAIIWTNDVIC